MVLEINTCPALIMGITDQELKQNAWNAVSDALWFGDPLQYKERMNQAIQSLKEKYPNQHNQLFCVLKKFSESDFQSFFLEEGDE